MNANHYQNKLNPLENNRDLKLTAEQKAVIHTKAKTAKRAPKDVAYLIVPTLALTELPNLYSGKYAGTKGNHAFRLELYRLFLHIIYTTHKNNSENQEEYFPLHSQILKNLMGRNKEQGNYAAIRTDLKEWDYIEVNDNYSFNSKNDIAAKNIKDVYCKSYRLTERVRTGEFISYRAKGTKYVQKTEKGIQGLTSVLLVDESQPQYAWLYHCLTRLSMAPAAQQWIQHQQLTQAPLKDKEKRVGKVWKKFTNRTVTKEIAESYRNTMEEINNRYADSKPFFKINTTSNNRLESSLTNMATGLRQSVIVDGVTDKLAYIDLSSSQVYLSLKLIQKTSAVKNSNGHDFNKFAKLALDGNFYEDLKSIIESTSDFKVEGDAKVNYFKHVQYSNNHKCFGYRKEFNRLFPVINQAILELVENAKDKQEGLAVLLQKEEANVFLDKICLHLYNALGPNKFIATMHDGIICEAEDFDIVYNIMFEVLNKHTGFAPHLKASNFQEAKKQNITMITQDNWLTAVISKEITFEKVAEIFAATEAEIAIAQQETESWFAERVATLPEYDWRKDFIRELENEYKMRHSIAA